MQILRFAGENGFQGGSVIAIGFFDGVHIAHRALIERAKKEARSRSLSLGVFTFSSESGIKPDAKRIYTTSQRLGLLSDMGVDFAVVCDFADISDIGKEEFVRDVLIGKYGARLVVAGYNFRFGKGAAGSSSDLCKLAAKHGIDALIVPRLEYKGRAVSSSLVRGYIESTRLTEATELLATPYFVDGAVEHGLGIGSRRLGFATLNLPSGVSGIALPHGVYRVAVRLSHGIFSGVANVGVCPTFPGREAHTEVHIIDFDGDLYGENVRVYFLGYLRSEIKFESEKELIMQINIDKKRAINENGDVKWIING